MLFSCSGRADLCPLNFATLIRHFFFLMMIHELVSWPIKQRSVRVLADNFRWIVKHIQTFSKSHLLPQYKKQGSSSLIRLGFTPYHEGGISRRPQLPNTPQLCDFLHGLLQKMPHEPPYHTEIPFPDLPADPASQSWPDWPEVPADQRDSFLILVRNAMARKKDFDTIRHPNAN